MDGFIVKRDQPNRRKLSTNKLQLITTEPVECDPPRWTKRNLSIIAINYFSTAIHAPTSIGLFISFSFFANNIFTEKLYSLKGFGLGSFDFKASMWTTRPHHGPKYFFNY